MRLGAFRTSVTEIPVEISVDRAVLKTYSNSCRANKTHSYSTILSLRIADHIRSQLSVSRHTDRIDKPVVVVVYNWGVCVTLIASTQGSIAVRLVQYEHIFKRFVGQY